jgi:hypothetical protein
MELQMNVRDSERPLIVIVGDGIPIFGSIDLERRAVAPSRADRRCAHGTTSLKEGTAVMVQRMLAAHGLHCAGD